MNIKQYLDSTYLKTANQAGVSEEDNYNIAKSFIQEAIDPVAFAITSKTSPCLVAVKKL